ncbi:hypothetical protein ACFLYV_00625 [Chloroflexota bacterium]
MTDWKVTAITIFCEDVCDEVTFIVDRAWQANCVSAPKYLNPDKEVLKAFRIRAENDKRPECTGAECPRLAAYVAKLQAEEAGAPPTGQNAAQKNGE